MTQPQPYVPTAREQKFLEGVEEGRYEREIISGLGPFFNEKAPEDMLNFYSKDEVTRLQALKGEGRIVLAGPHPAVDSNDPGAAGFTGSLIVAEFDSLSAAQAWADADPYIAAGVYANVIVKPFKQVLP